MKPRILAGILFFWAISISVAYANVRINEIAWMGTSVSGTNEWIELFNDGEGAVDLSGWTIVADDGSPSIILSGNIAAHSFFLIERTDDTTVPDISADQIASFGNGLSNSGEMLRLKDLSGTALDVVAGGSDWSNIGGNNATKETAQRLFVGWTTATATPRSANIATFGTVSSSSSNTMVASSQEKAISPAENPVSKAPVYASQYPRQNITVMAGEDKNAFVGFLVSFSGQALGLYDESLPYATYRWNFGDGATGEGKSVPHTYFFPGEYTVTFDVAFGHLRNTDRLIVTVANPDVLISNAVEGNNGYLSLHNRSTNDVDLSLWRLRTDGGATFTIPGQTILLAGRSIIFPNATTKLLSFSGATLYSPQETMIATFPLSGPNMPEVRGAAIQRAEKVSNEPPLFVSEKIVSEKNVSIVPLMEIQDQQKTEDGLSAAEGSVASVVWSKELAEKNRGNDGAFLLTNITLLLSIFIGALLMIFAGIIISRSNIDQVSPAEEYAIMEDIIEGKDNV